MIRYVIALSELGIKNSDLIFLLQNYFSDIGEQWQYKWTEKIGSIRCQLFVSDVLEIWVD